MSDQPSREEAIFHEAMECQSPEERAAFLREACGGDGQLRQRVEVLLHAAEQAGSFLEQHAAPFGVPPSGGKGGEKPAKAGTPNSPQLTVLHSIASVYVSEKPGDRIGHYKLLEQIGEGGCGVVYMAEQTEPIRRRVAFKVIKLGMDTKQVVARFEAERQALALMDHPNIAKVLDAGATNTDRPYFVMELVKGIKITDYCDQENLNTKERVELFMQVCHAVQHAHQKGIIHRDLKPTNILVTLHDGVPVAKVIDFGIAKATQQPLTDKTLFTAYQQFIGTPAYTSPEQAEMSGLDIDTRSDIYTLGVLLYELLTGGVPFEQKELLQAGFDEMRRLIREKEPPKPSTRLSTLNNADLTRVAKHHGAAPPRLISLVRGDLDWIVMKCLEKDRARRYSTADALADDLERHLNDEPVTAAAQGRLYHLTKLVRRHRRSVVAAVLLILALMGGLVWQTVQVKRAAQQKRLVAKFFENALKGVRLSVALGRDTTLLREVLAQASAQVGQELEEQPEAQADVRLTIGFLYQDLEDYSGAEAAFRAAREAYRRLYSDKHPGIAASTFGLALAALKQGHYAEAESRARLALTSSLGVFASNDTVVVHSLGCLATALEAQDKLDEAEARCREAINLGRKLPDQEKLLIADSLSTLAKVLWKQGRPSEAVLALNEALDLRKKMLGARHPDVAKSRNALIDLLTKAGESAKAKVLARETDDPTN